MHSDGKQGPPESLGPAPQNPPPPAPAAAAQQEGRADALHGPQSHVCAASEPETEPEPEPLLLRVRAFDPSDLNFVLSAHLQSGRNEGHGQWMTNSSQYFAAEQEAFAHLAQYAQILVACSADRLREVWRFICFEPGSEGSLVVHSLYVKQLVRRRGVARMLLESADWRSCVRVFGTRWSQKASRLAARFSARYRPHLL